MKKMLVTLQVLAICSLSANQELAAYKSAQKADPCAKVCDPDPCPCFEKGDDALETMPMACKYSPAYNLPANVTTTGCWDFYADASYLYWFTKQDGMDLATTNYVVGTTARPSIEGGHAVFQDFKYTSGFKAGLGANLNFDDWVADLEYTYVRQKTHKSSGAAPTSAVGTGVFNLTGWFYESYSAGGIVADSFNSKWKFGLDWIDLTFKRPYYQGTKLVVTPSAGLRASWIRESLKITSTNAYNVVEQTSADAALDVSRNHSNSWAIGPRTLIEARWIMGDGFRFQGNMGGSLLFTQYTTVSHKETGTAFRAHPVEFKVSNYNCIRPMAEGNLGIGWGTYIYDKSYHVDLSATYDFNYLWSQNMIRYIAEVNGPAHAGEASDLYMHGATVKARFDF